MGFKGTLYKRYSVFFIISVLIVSVVVIKIQREILLEGMKDKAAAVASVLSAVSVDSIITYDYVTMERYVKEITDNKDLLSVRVIRKDGELLAESKHYDKENDNNVIFIDYPLILAGDSIGHIEMIFTKRNIDNITMQIILYTVVFVLLVHLAGLFINNKIINSLIMNPINMLVNATKKIKQGEYNLNIKLNADDEFNALAEALNDMSSTIQKNVEELILRQNTIENEKNKMETIIDSIADGLFVTDKEEKIVAFNKAAEQITGYEKGEVLDKFCETIFKSSLCKDTCALRHLEKPIRHKETRLFTKDGRELIVVVSSSLIKSITGEILGGVQTFRDITLEIQQKAIMSHAEKLAAIGQMTAGIAHEINNPIGNVAGYAKLLLKNSSLDKGVKEKLEIIHEQSLKAASIVSELLNFSRKNPINKNIVDIDGVIKNVINFHMINITGKNIKITYESSCKCFLKGDERQIEQVIFNIVLNAIQAIKNDGEIRINTFIEKDFLNIIILDNGPGILEENLKNIFSPFFTTKPSGEGTGLGLFVCEKIVKDHGGSIEVESKPGEFTKFTVKLPAVGKCDE